MEKKLVIAVSGHIANEIVEKLPTMACRGIQIMFHAAPVCGFNGECNYDYVVTIPTYGTPNPYGFRFLGDFTRRIPVKDCSIDALYRLQDTLEKATKKLGINNDYLIEPGPNYNPPAPGYYPPSSGLRASFDPQRGYDPRLINTPMHIPYSVAFYYAFGEVVETQTFGPSFMSLFGEKEGSQLLQVLKEVARIEDFDIALFHVGRNTSGDIVFRQSIPYNGAVGSPLPQVLELAVKNFIDKTLAEEKPQTSRKTGDKPKATVAQKKRAPVKKVAPTA